MTALYNGAMFQRQRRGLLRQCRIRPMHRASRPAEKTQSFQSIILRRINVSVKNRATVLATIRASSKRDIVCGQPAGATALLRRGMRAHLHQPASSNCSLVGKLVRNHTRTVQASHGSNRAWGGRELSCPSYSTLRVPNWPNAALQCRLRQHGWHCVAALGAGVSLSRVRTSSWYVCYCRAWRVNNCGNTTSPACSTGLPPRTVFHWIAKQ